MSDDDLFDDINDVPWDDIGRMNQDGFIETDQDQTVFFDDQFEMRSRELQASPPGMKTVNVFPAKQGPWSGNNQLGIGQRFAPDSNNLQTVLKLDEWGMPEMWTLCLGLAYDINNWQPVDGSASFDITAIIQFGIGGVVQEVEIDWINGAGISLPMNALNVIAQYNLDVASEAGGASEPPNDLLLRASLAHGTLFQCEPTRSFKVESPATINIPPFAKAVRIIPTNVDQAEVFLFYAQPGTIAFNSGTSFSTGFTLTVHTFQQFVQFFSMADQTLGPPSAIPVPTGARSIVITGNGIGEIASTPILVQFLIGI